jgi:hypothetical protein
MSRSSGDGEPRLFRTGLGDFERTSRRTQSRQDMPQEMFGLNANATNIKINQCWNLAVPVCL